MKQYYKIAPHFLQNTAISVYNIIQYRIRYGNRYNAFKKIFKENKQLDLDSLKELQASKYTHFLTHVTEQSVHYKEKFHKIKNNTDIAAISTLPLITKEEVRKNFASIKTIYSGQGVTSQTGGTTGKALQVLYTKTNMQERFAMLDTFRSEYGYRLGKKTAWFSGKDILTSRDINKKRFWKTDYFYKARYYSTFHIKHEYLTYYLENLINFNPQFLIGYPSSMLEIAEFGLSNGIDFPSHAVKAIFPTAESLSENNIERLETFFKAKVYNQYASSEGAPFIMECRERNLHLELQSGVFEVLDEHNTPVSKGRLVVTSFTTYGTPLVRYDIGDDIELMDGVCSCGNNNPLVKEIVGRIDDYIYSPQNGKIHLGNISNTLKDVVGVIKFQVEQNELEALMVTCVIDSSLYVKEAEVNFNSNWRDRIGQEMKLTFIYVDDISNEKSGKFRMVKNNIKHLLK